jgi:hypothetical protein
MVSSGDGYYPRRGDYEKRDLEKANRKAPGDFELPFGAFFSVFPALTIYMKIDRIFKTDKEEMKMGTKKSIFVLLGVFFFMAGFLGSANEVGAETLKLKALTSTKSEVFPIGMLKNSVFFL